MTDTNEDRLGEAKQKAYDHEQSQGQVVREEDYQALDEAFDLIRWLVQECERLGSKYSEAKDLLFVYTQGRDRNILKGIEKLRDEIKMMEEMATCACLDDIAELDELSRMVRLPVGSEQRNSLQAKCLSREIESWQGFGRTVEAMAGRKYLLIIEQGPPCGGDEYPGEGSIDLCFWKNDGSRKQSLSHGIVINDRPETWTKEKFIKAAHLAALGCLKNV